MSCRSDEKVLCPWCGAEMNDRWYVNELGRFGNYVCDDCWAESPEVEWPDGMPKKEWDALVKAAALRRYTPMLNRPIANFDEALDKDIEIEIKGEGSLRKVRIPDIARIAKSLEIRVPFNIMHTAPVVLLVEDYGKTWRCWERKPTDEERSAAEWD